MILGYAVLVLHRRNDAKRLASIVATALLAIFAFAVIGLFEAAAKSDNGGVSSCAVSGQRAVRRGPFNIPTRPVAGYTGRILENRYAIEKFLESPVFGKGLSYAVPSNLIFSGQEDYLRCLETIHGKKYPFVYYTHNLAAYIAMTMGIDRDNRGDSDHCRHAVFSRAKSARRTGSANCRGGGLDGIRAVLAGQRRLHHPPIQSADRIVCGHPCRTNSWDIDEKVSG
jgi:hypothetical protein